MRTCPGESLKRAPAAEALAKREDLRLPKTSPKNSSPCKKHSPAHNLDKSWGFFDLDCDGD